MRLKITLLYILALFLILPSASSQNTQDTIRPARAFINKLIPKKNPKTIEVETPTEGRISFDKTFFDYGEVEQGSNTVAEFVISNLGGEPVKILDVKTSCGCVVVDYPQEEIPPLQSITLRVKYNTNLVGEIKRSIVVYSNDQKQPKTMLRLIGKVVRKK